MDQFSEIQTEGMPPLPKETGNARVDAAARAEHFKATVAFFETKGQSGFAERGKVSAEPAPGGVEPNADDIAAIDAALAGQMKHYPGNNAAAALIDRARMDAFAGKRLDRDAFAASLERAVETSDDRAQAKAVNDLLPHVDANGTVPHDKIPERLMCGYSLPVGEYRAEETLALLRTARELGLTQSQIDKYVELQDAEQ